MTTDKPDGSPTPARLRVSALRQTGPTRFRLEPGPEARAAHAAELGAQSLKKLRFAGQLSPLGKHGWRLEGTTARVRKEMVADPVRRISALAVELRFAKGLPEAARGPLLRAAETCPVSQSLHADLAVEVHAIWSE